jgi:hypothetical protein
MERADLLSAMARSDKAIIDCWEQHRMVRGDGRPGRGRGLQEEDDDKYQSRMDFGALDDTVLQAMAMAKVDAVDKGHKKEKGVD